MAFGVVALRPTVTSGPALTAAGSKTDLPRAGVERRVVTRSGYRAGLAAGQRNRNHPDPGPRKRLPAIADHVSN
jgi:hypothetical protein